MAKSPSRIDPITLDLYTKLVATVAGVELKGATVPYTAVNGNMFSMIGSGGEVAIRLPSPHREAFITKYKTRVQVEHGVVRDEYVLMPATLLAKTKEAATYFAKSAEYARSLKPKATTRSKKKATGSVKSRRRKSG